MSKKPFDVIGILDEPWVELADGHALATWGHEDEVAYNQVNRQREKHRFFVRAFDFLKDNRIRGNYLEFGCHRARTFRMALTEARRHSMDWMKFFAFDSFEGLPDNPQDHYVEIWQRGALTTSVEHFRELVNSHGIYADRIETIKGFYVDSLTPALQRRFLDNEDKAALVTVDCDLYESAVPVFRFIEPLLQEGTIIYIDDLFAGYRGSPEKGVARAWRGFRQRSRFQFLRHVEVGWWGRAYIAYLGEPLAEGEL